MITARFSLKNLNIGYQVEFTTAFLTLVILETRPFNNYLEIMLRHCPSSQTIHFSKFHACGRGACLRRRRGRSRRGGENENINFSNTQQKLFRAQTRVMHVTIRRLWCRSYFKIIQMFALHTNKVHENHHVNILSLKYLPFEYFQHSVNLNIIGSP